MKTCNLCKEKHYGRGYCLRHYRKIIYAEKDRQYAATHKIELAAYKKEWRLRRKEHIRSYMQKKRSQDSNYRVADALRNRFKAAFRNGAKRGSAVKLLGCTIPEFRIYVERKFQPGMTWENYGAWHLDHVRPLASFDLSSDAAVQEACHFLNLQPLWAADNYSKGARV